MPTFLQGISRVLNCPKVHVTVTGLVTTWFAVRYAATDLPPTQQASLWVAFIGAVAVVLREIINAWTEEDVAAVAAGGVGKEAERARRADAGTGGNSTSPAGGGVVTPGLSPGSCSNIQSTAPVATPSALHSVANVATNTRSPNMPPRTTLPSILIASALIAIFAAGCQTSPELTAYREGLHQIDEPLYQAHLLLLNDAVNANIRTPADQQVVQQGIAAAEALYQQSKATEAAGVPATQP
jgi:hypothetical protein